MDMYNVYETCDWIPNEFHKRFCAMLFSERTQFFAEDWLQQSLTIRFTINSIPIFTRFLCSIFFFTIEMIRWLMTDAIFRSTNNFVFIVVSHIIRYIHVSSYVNLEMQIAHQRKICPVVIVQNQRKSNTVQNFRLHAIKRKPQKKKKTTKLIELCVVTIYPLPLFSR